MTDRDVEAIESELSKRDRLVNAWLAAGADANVDTVAQLSGASGSYASRIGRSLADGEITEAAVDEARVPELVEAYERRLETGAVGERAGGSAQSGAGTEESAPSGGPAPRGEPPDGTAPPSGEPGQSPGTGQPPREGPPPETSAGGGQRRPPAGMGERDRESTGPGVSVPQEDRYVPVEVLAEIDNALSLYEEEARYEVQHSSPQGPQNQVALAKLFVLQKTRALLGDAAENAVTLDET